MHCGYRPLLPWWLSHPELVLAGTHEDALYGEGQLVTALVRARAVPRAWSDDRQRA